MNTAQKKLQAFQRLMSALGHATQMIRDLEMAVELAREQGEYMEEQIKLMADQAHLARCQRDEMKARLELVARKESLGAKGDSWQ